MTRPGWCSTAHMLIANVTLFHADGTIGPIDELELSKWQELRDPEVMPLLEQRLVGRRAPMARVARRLHAPKGRRSRDGSRPADLPGATAQLAPMLRGDRSELGSKCADL